MRRQDCGGEPTWEEGSQLSGLSTGATEREKTRDDKGMPVMMEGDGKEVTSKTGSNMLWGRERRKDDHETAVAGEALRTRASLLVKKHVKEVLRSMERIQEVGRAPVLGTIKRFKL